MIEDDDLASISERLLEQGLISDAGVFEWYVERNGGLEITPGYFEIRPNDHMGNVLGRLRTPPGQTYTKVTFPEGFTVAKMADRLDTTDRPVDRRRLPGRRTGSGDPLGRGSPKVSRRSKGCCSPTRTRCRTPRARDRSSSG